jgi:hypothetical protein
MKYLKIILPLLMLLSFSVIVILPNSLNICIPDGCNFNSSTCDNNACINETVTQHLSERAQFLNAIIEFQSFIILAIVLILFFVIQKYLEDGKLATAKSYIKHKLLNSPSTKLFDYLIEVFSNGIIHPKIY